MFFISSFINILILLLLAMPAFADDPWFTGPLIAIPGKTIPPGHSFLVFFAPYTAISSKFNEKGERVAARHTRTFQANPLYTYGLAENLDVQFSVPYIFKQAEENHRRHIGDVSVLLGYQALRQQDSYLKPNLRITLQQIFPTGKFLALSPANEGSDGTGLGSYQTNLGFNFQHLLPIEGKHFLRSRFNLNYLYAQKVSIRGISVFGGTANTRGQIKPGNLYSIDISTEFSLTKHWVLVMESYYFSRGSAHFKGFPGLGPIGKEISLDQGKEYSLTFAPAIEYNFSAQYGIIAGIWFPVKGKNSPDFLSTIIAFNAYW
ncbi:transporter [Legionella londiniensis]|uniref:Fe-S protein n=1 Tax=Legionella londiniensis TaxID=45068 RepID=A0A0W0VJQ2_9GAMM|nr:transporter [Legionella londiniensis]KTD20327.1 Fe-S protein [Legionella londiniensis]STX93929.1 Fe-S protein [Legionella londiniensis]